MTVLMGRRTPGTAGWICKRRESSRRRSSRWEMLNKHCYLQSGIAMFVLGKLGYLWLTQLPSGQEAEMTSSGCLHGCTEVVPILVEEGKPFILCNMSWIFG